MISGARLPTVGVSSRVEPSRMATAQRHDGVAMATRPEPAIARAGAVWAGMLQPGAGPQGVRGGSASGFFAHLTRTAGCHWRKRTERRKPILCRAGLHRFCPPLGRSSGRPAVSFWPFGTAQRPPGHRLLQVVTDRVTDPDRKNPSVLPGVSRMSRFQTPVCVSPPGLPLPPAGVSAK